MDATTRLGESFTISVDMDNEMEKCKRVSDPSWIGIGYRTLSSGMSWDQDQGLVMQEWTNFYVVSVKTSLSD